MRRSVDDFFDSVKDTTASIALCTNVITAEAGIHLNARKSKVLAQWFPAAMLRRDADFLFHPKLEVTICDLK
jgi:hypothetical protein